MDWRKKLNQSARVTYAIYFSSLVLAVASYFVFPAGARTVDAEWKMYFQEILVLAGVTVLFARWWGTQLFSQTALEIRYRVNGIEGVLSGLKIAALTGAGLADFCLVLGIFFYAFTRDVYHLSSMAAFWGIHLGMSIACLRRGRAELETFAAKGEALSKAA